MTWYLFFYIPKYFYGISHSLKTYCEYGKKNTQLIRKQEKNHNLKPKISENRQKKMTKTKVKKSENKLDLYNSSR